MPSLTACLKGIDISFLHTQIKRNSPLQVMDIVHSALREACSSSGYLATRLIHAARLIFELYLDVLPVHHRDGLAQFPQQSALALTNCMFMSYQCVTLGMSYKVKLPDDLGRRFFSFADMVVKVRDTGLHIFQVCTKQFTRDCTVHRTGPNLRTGQRPVKSGPGPVPFSMYIMSNSLLLWSEIGTLCL